VSSVPGRGAQCGGTQVWSTKCCVVAYVPPSFRGDPGVVCHMFDFRGGPGVACHILWYIYGAVPVADRASHIFLWRLRVRVGSATYFV